MSVEELIANYVRTIDKAQEEIASRDLIIVALSRQHVEPVSMVGLENVSYTAETKDGMLTITTTGMPEAPPVVEPDDV